MKLGYSHSWRQFFFLTLTVAGREKILSRLVDAQSRPALSEAGEVVKAALLALHRVNAAVTVSDFVIMPDHFHFIMIVDYGRDRLARRAPCLGESSTATATLSCRLTRDSSRRSGAI